VDDSSQKWIAVQISNSSSTQILSHRMYDVLIGDASGAIVDSSFEPSFPILGPSQSAWYVATQFNTNPSSQVVFRKAYSTSPSPLSVNEFPTTSNPRLVTSSNPARRSIVFSLKNNSSTGVLSASSQAYVVLLNSEGVPIYADRGSIRTAILPGGTAEITIGQFSFTGSYSSIQVAIGANLQ